jgi:5-formyltetrahydrofolate cyclo-ligase
MWRVDNEEEKRLLRRSILAQRAALTAEEALCRSRAIQVLALQTPTYQACRGVALYSATGGEVRTRAILKDALESGRRVFYPRTCRDGDGEFVAVLSESDLHIGRHGIYEPVGGESLCGADFSSLAIFVPGVAFDRRGNRLGRGQGWYDRMLAGLRGSTIVALAYEFQLVDRVPASAWDRKVHYIVTENCVIDCGSGETSAPDAAIVRKGVF